MATVVISPCNVVNFSEAGGHFWVYMQYARALRQLGCDVYWLESFRSSGHPDRDAEVLAPFFERMERYGFGGKVILYTSCGSVHGTSAPIKYVGMSPPAAEAIFRRADLLLNFHYAIDPALLGCFRRRALVDIDPGLLQFWIAVGQLVVPEYDCYFTTGETVGTGYPPAGAAMFPDCGLSWMHVRPPVCLELWPYVYGPHCEALTTVSSWWGGDGSGKGEWITDGKEVSYDNSKRVSFLEFLELPRRTSQALELALYLSEGKGASPQDPESQGCREMTPGPGGIPDYKGDIEDRRLLESHGWRIRHSRAVASTPEAYQSYIQGSRGEFSCAKPSCMKFQNAWISDRTLCYLASGKPAVVQNTGPSSFLPNGEGIFRFSTMGEAVDALARVNAHYERHCRAAREIVEAYFDARQVLERILNCALSG